MKDCLRLLVEHLESLDNMEREGKLQNSHKLAYELELLFQNLYDAVSEELKQKERDRINAHAKRLGLFANTSKEC